MSIDLLESVERNEYPLLGDRVQSTFIDLLVMVGLTFFLSTVLDRYENAPDWLRVIFFAGVWVFYDPVLTAYACTPGNLIKGIRVRRVNNTQLRIGLGSALIRYAIKLVLGWISFLTINSNKERRALHDFAAGSVMVLK